MLKKKTKIQDVRYLTFLEKLDSLLMKNRKLH